MSNIRSKVVRTLPNDRSKYFKSCQIIVQRSPKRCPTIVERSFNVGQQLSNDSSTSSDSCPILNQRSCTRHANLLCKLVVVSVVVNVEVTVVVGVDVTVVVADDVSVVVGVVVGLVCSQPPKPQNPKTPKPHDYANLVFVLMKQVIAN